MFNVVVKISGKAPAVILAVQRITADKRGFFRVLGQVAVDELHRHFTALERKHKNKMGAPRSHFWLEVRDSVQQPRLNGFDSITININHAFLPHKAGFGPAGGHIYPKAPRQWLTIPVVKDAYTKSAEQWERDTGKKLLFIKKSEQTAFLAEVKFTQAKRGERSKGWGTIRKTSIVRLIFVLKKHVYQPPMPDALPTEMRWQKVLGGAARDYFQSVIDMESSDSQK